MKKILAAIVLGVLQGTAISRWRTDPTVNTILKATGYFIIKAGGTIR